MATHCEPVDLLFSNILYFYFQYLTHLLPIKNAPRVALVPEASIDSHVIYSAQIMHAHAQIMHHVCAGCSQLSNKKI